MRVRAVSQDDGPSRNKSALHPSFIARKRSMKILLIPMISLDMFHVENW
jgi:hypothetical protein